ncbi:MAG: hypothetical protein M3R27_12240, partial [Bacteroidota bacterium]|nr:hypothetical protein [Bacteroidota bacterium]
MKQFSLTTKAIGKFLVLPALAVVMFSVGSCKKEQLGRATPESGLTQTEKRSQMRASIAKVLREFAESSPGGSSSTTTSGGGSST